jgi:hypothetical protein
MRWHYKDWSPSRVVSVALAFTSPLCANCGLLFEGESHHSATRAGRPERWCQDCQYEKVGWRGGRQKAIEKGLGFYSDGVFEVRLTLAQRNQRIETAKVDGRKTYGVLLFKRCANPECIEPGMCISQTDNGEHLLDMSCHFPAWIMGERRKYCSDNCGKRHARAVQKLRNDSEPINER